MKILVVEDEVKLANAIKRAFLNRDRPDLGLSLFELYRTSKG